jgi:predicted transposase YbfD/YdcC
LRAALKENGADYLLRVKKNTKELREAMRLRLAQKGASEGEKASDSVPTGGRADSRNITVLDASLIRKMLPEGLRHAARFGVVRKSAYRKSRGKTVDTEHFFITSLCRSQASAADLLKRRREHWSVENDLHRAKDLFLDEDKCRRRKDNAPYSWASLRSCALNLLRKISPNIPEAIDLCAANPKFFFKIAT